MGTCGHILPLLLLKPRPQPFFPLSFNTLWPPGFPIHFPNKSTVYQYKAGCRSLHLWGIARGSLKVHYWCLLSNGVFFSPKGYSEALSFFFIPPKFKATESIGSGPAFTETETLTSMVKCIP